MVNVRAAFIGLPHGTTPAAVTTNKNIKMSSFMSSKNIQKKVGGLDRSVSDNEKLKSFNWFCATLRIPTVCWFSKLRKDIWLLPSCKKLFSISYLYPLNWIKYDSFGYSLVIFLFSGGGGCLQDKTATITFLSLSKKI